MLHHPSQRAISVGQLQAAATDFYVRFVVVESKCIEMGKALASHQPRYESDVICFLDAIPDSVLVHLQRGGIDPEGLVRNALQSSCERIKVRVEQWNKLPRDGANGATQTELDLHVPTIEEGFHGFLVAQESRAKKSGSPDYQSLVVLTTKTIGDEGRAKVASGPNILTIGCDLVKAIDKATGRAKRNIAKQAREKEAQEAQSKAGRAEQVSKSKAEEEARQNSIHKVCQCCGPPLCTHQTVVKAHGRDGGGATKKQNNVELWTPPTDDRPLNSTTLYKKIAQVYCKCVEGRGPNISLTDDQYRDLTALHTTGMEETYDFLLVSGHPRASGALKRLRVKYAILERLWRHCIHSYLEVLRARSPESLEHMICFTLRSYSMMQLLGETTDNGEYAIECTGDLARYRFVKLPLRRPMAGCTNNPN